MPAVHFPHFQLNSIWCLVIRLRSRSIGQQCCIGRIVVVTLHWTVAAATCKVKFSPPALDKCATISISQNIHSCTVQQIIILFVLNNKWKVYWCLEYTCRDINLRIVNREEFYMKTSLLKTTPWERDSARLHVTWLMSDVEIYLFALLHS